VLTLTNPFPRDIFNFDRAKRDGPTVHGMDTASSTGDGVKAGQETRYVRLVFLIVRSITD
jgi:hypothetical protein